MDSPPHLPADWTPEDQRIIEQLLFDAPPGSPASPTRQKQLQQGESPADATRAGLEAPASPARLWLPSVQLAAQQEPMVDERLMAMLRWQSAEHRKRAAEARRVKHREVQRRFMQRKREQRTKVKVQLARLEAELKVLQLATEEKRLERSNEALKAELESKDPVPLPSQEQIHKLLEEQLELIRDHYEPLTNEQWDDLTAMNLREMEDAAVESGYESTGAVVLGWSDQRKIDKTGTKFVLSKSFPHLDAQEFRDTTWEKLLLEKTHQQLFHAAVTIRTQVVQRVDDNGVVFHRVMFNPMTGGVVHAIEASVRVKYRGKFILFQRTLEYNAAFECVPKSHNWMQLMTSLIYSPGSSRGSCEFQYAGILKNLAPADARFWLMEMLWVILRFESVMVAPLFRLAGARNYL